jgi:hypothetical protein
VRPEYSRNHHACAGLALFLAWIVSRTATPGRDTLELLRMIAGLELSAAARIASGDRLVGDPDLAERLATAPSGGQPDAGGAAVVTRLVDAALSRHEQRVSAITPLRLAAP